MTLGVFQLKNEPSRKVLCNSLLWKWLMFMPAWAGLWEGGLRGSLVVMGDFETVFLLSDCS